MVGGRPGMRSHLRYGLLSAGDSNYPTFCGFGQRLHTWLQASGARLLFEPVDVDCEDEMAVQRWRVAHALSRDRPPRRRQQ